MCGTGKTIPHEQADIDLLGSMQIWYVDTGYNTVAELFPSERRCSFYCRQYVQSLLQHAISVADNTL